MCDTIFIIDAIIVRGILSVISPWNVPLHLSTRAVAPALVLSIDPSSLVWKSREIYVKIGSEGFAFIISSDINPQRRE
jgi:hypothetical protein